MPISSIRLIREIEERGALMATIARAEALLGALGHQADQLGPQIWIDPHLGLVGGIFPNATAWFDFAGERAVPLGDRTITAATAAVPGSKPFISLVHEAKRVIQLCDIETADAVHRLGSVTQALIHGLNLIEAARPGTIERLGHLKKRSKRPVARTRAELYDVNHPDAHSERLENGWFVATNNKSAEAVGVMRQAAELAGLVWGVDFIVRIVR